MTVSRPCRLVSISTYSNFEPVDSRHSIELVVARYQENANEAFALSPQKCWITNFVLEVANVACKDKIWCLWRYLELLIAADRNIMLEVDGYHFTGIEVCYLVMLYITNKLVR